MLGVLRKIFITLRGLLQIPVYTATKIAVLLDYAKLNDVLLYVHEIITHVLFF